MTPGEALRNWLGQRLDDGARTWLFQVADELAGGAPARRFFLSFSSVPRRIGKAALEPTEGELAEAEAARPGWDPRSWTVDEAGRALLVLARTDAETPYAETIEQAFQAADLGELTALYRTLPLLPRPEQWTERCAEGIRTNMTSVFCAIAHDNPYPSEQLAEAPWNQMVLKALFVDVELAPIVGLDDRANPELMRMLCDYAHERWAAGRTVSPELWRCVGPFADDAAVADLERALEGGCEGALFALEHCPHDRARDILERHRRP